MELRLDLSQRTVDTAARAGVEIELHHGGRRAHLDRARLGLCLFAPALLLRAVLVRVGQRGIPLLLLALPPTPLLLIGRLVARRRVLLPLLVLALFRLALGVRVGVGGALGTFFLGLLTGRRGVRVRVALRVALLLLALLARARGGVLVLGGRLGRALLALFLLRLARGGVIVALVCAIGDRICVPQGTTKSGDLRQALSAR